MTSSSPLKMACMAIALCAAATAPAQTLTTLVNFTGSNGRNPGGSLVQGADGNFYGTTNLGGFENNGTIFKLDHRGVSILYRFPGGSSGGGPFGLMQATDSNFYGVAGRGSSNAGVLFKITTAGVYTVLQSFTNETGAYPLAAPLQDTNGLLYGTTSLGGTNGFGTVYSIDLGFGPCVALVGYISQPGRTVQILGQGLTGSTAVAFNGIPATSFQVVSDTYMTAVVPAGATTGPVVVTTPTGTLTSNKNLTIPGSAGVHAKGAVTRSHIKR